GQYPWAPIILQRRGSAVSSPPSEQPPNLSSQRFRPGSDATPAWWSRFVTLYAPVVRRWALPRACRRRTRTTSFSRSVLTCAEASRAFSVTGAVSPPGSTRLLGTGSSTITAGRADNLRPSAASDDSATAGLPPEALSPLVRRALDLVHGEFEPRTL